MILDTLQNVERYASLGEHFATACRFLKETDLSTLPLGAVEIDGKNVFANLADNLLERTEPAYEAHEAYADIQVILRGQERMAWGDPAEYDPLPEGSDFRTCHDVQHPVEMVLQAGQFVIFLPHEPHAPGLTAGEPCHCLKLVVKVKVN